jgi:hypothetical protein
MRSTRNAVVIFPGTAISTSRNCSWVSAFGATTIGP